MSCLIIDQECGPGSGTNRDCSNVVPEQQLSWVCRRLESRISHLRPPCSLDKSTRRAGPTTCIIIIMNYYFVTSAGPMKRTIQKGSRIKGAGKSVVYLHWVTSANRIMWCNQDKVHGRSQLIRLICSHGCALWL